MCVYIDMFVCIILYHCILLCVILCGKSDIVYYLVMTLLLTKYLASTEMLVYTADCVVKHLLACSHASVNFHASFNSFFVGTE